MPPDSAASETPLRHVHKALPHDSAAKHVAGAPTTSTTFPSRRARCTSPSAVRRSRAGPSAASILREVHAAPGVVAVVTAADIPGNNDVAPAFADEPVFAAGSRRSSTASRCSPWSPTRATRRARAALRARVRVSKRSARDVSVEQAQSGRRARAARLRLHARRRRARRSPRRRIAARGTLRIGGQEHSISKARSRSPCRGEDGDMLVYSSTQHPTEVQHVVAHVLGAAGCTA